MNNLTIENFGEIGYMAFRKSDENNSTIGRIDNMVFHPFSGSKVLPNEVLTLNDDLITKFYIGSISILGLYIFHTLLFPTK